MLSELLLSTNSKMTWHNGLNGYVDSLAEDVALLRGATQAAVDLLEEVFYQSSYVFTTADRTTSLLNTT